MKWSCSVDPTVYDFGFQRKGRSYKDSGISRNIAGRRNGRHKKDWPRRVLVEQTAENKSWAHQYSWRWLSKRISQGRERSERSGRSKQNKPPRQYGRLQAGLEFTWTKEMLNQMSNTEEANQKLKSSCFPCKDVNGQDHVGAALGRWWDTAVLSL